MLEIGKKRGLERISVANLGIGEATISGSDLGRGGPDESQLWTGLTVYKTLHSYGSREGGPEWEKILIADWIDCGQNTGENIR